MNRIRRCVPVVALLAAFAFVHASRASAAEEAKPNTLSAKELAEGWILLFDGETTFGWKAASKADWKVESGVISVAAGEPGLLCTTSEFADYELKVDFRADKDTNSGIFLRTPAEPKDPASDCYELNIADPDVSPFPNGSFVQRKKSRASPVNGAWRTYHAKADGGKFTVELDGVGVLEYTDEKPLGRGHIGLQLNKGKVEFRNIKLRPLGTKSIFNGKDLAGWKELPGKASKFSVTEKGELNVKNGPGQLETEGRWADLVLQAEVFSNGKHLNSGFFFRSIPGDNSNGYECQIQNGYKDDDRTKPVDCGTGGFYRRQNARKVVANDFEWFHITLIASGPQMAAWVNGYQVSDWIDTRKPHANPRNGQRLEAGTIIIQGHDPTTDLSFRNMRVGELPKR